LPGSGLINRPLNQKTKRAVAELIGKAGGAY
jgi:hypothetical protein